MSALKLRSGRASRCQLRHGQHWSSASERGPSELEGCWKNGLGDDGEHRNPSLHHCQHGSLSTDTLLVQTHKVVGKVCVILK